MNLVKMSAVVMAALSLWGCSHQAKPFTLHLATKVNPHHSHMPRIFGRIPEAKIMLRASALDPGGFALVQQAAATGLGANPSVIMKNTPTQNNLEIMTVDFASNTGSVSTPPTAGWKGLPVQNCPLISQRSFWKVAGQGEPTTYSFTTPAPYAFSAVVREISGNLTTFPIDQDLSQCNAAGTTLTTPALVPTNSNEWAVSAFGIANSATFTTTPQSGWNEDYQSMNINASFEGQEDQSTVSVSTTNSVTLSTSNAGVSELMLLGVAGGGCGSNCGSIPKHIITFAYDGQNGGQIFGTTATTTNSQSISAIQTWVNGAQGSTATGMAKNALDCPPGSPCMPWVYFNPNRELYNAAHACGADYPWAAAASEDWWQHTATPIGPNNRMSDTGVTGSCNGFPLSRYYPNPNSVGNQNYWRAWIRSHDTANNYMGVMEDLSGWSPFVNIFDVPAAPNGGVEINTEAQAAAARINFAKAMTWPDGTLIPILCNCIGPTHAGGIMMTDFSPFGQPNRYGGSCEGCVAANAPTRLVPKNVGYALDAIASQNVQFPNAFFSVLGYNGNPPGSSITPGADGSNPGQIQSRLYQLGLVWLGFNANNDNMIDWSDFITTNLTELGVYPEQSIYPTQPTIPQMKDPGTNLGFNGTGFNAACGFDSGMANGTGAKTYAVACGHTSDGVVTGVYARQWKKCYNFGVLIGSGQCAVVYNATSSAVTVSSTWKYADGTTALTLGFDHSLTVSGGDVVAAGCSNTTGCPSSVLKPLGAPFTIDSTSVPANSELFLFHS